MRNALAGRDSEGNARSGARRVAGMLLTGLSVLLPLTLVVPVPPAAAATAAGGGSPAAASSASAAPAGGGATVPHGIGPLGGTLTATGTSVLGTACSLRMDLMPNLVAQGTQVTAGTSGSPLAGFPPQLSPVCPVFTVTGASLPVSQVATVTIDAPALEGAALNRASIYEEQADGTWQFVPTSVDPTSARVSAYVYAPTSLTVLADLAPLRDVPVGYWAAPAIDRLLAAGVVQALPGGRYDPQAPVTRAQFVAMLVTAVGMQPAAQPTGFTDVPDGAWYAPYVSAAVQARIVQGTGLTSFDPDRPLDREAMAVLVARALGLDQQQKIAFTDIASIDNWAGDAVAATEAAGLIAGFPDGTFRPLADVTRAQAAEVLAGVIGTMAPNG